MNQHPPQYPPSREAEPDASLRTSSFSTRALAADQQIHAWRTRVGHLIGVLPSSQQLAEEFGANIDLHAVGDIIFTDARIDAKVLERSVARVTSVYCFSSHGNRLTARAYSAHGVGHVRLCSIFDDANLQAVYHLMKTKAKIARKYGADAAKLWIDLVFGQHSRRVSRDVR